MPDLHYRQRCVRFLRYKETKSECFTLPLVLIVNKSFSVAIKILTSLSRNNSVLNVIINVAVHSVQALSENLDINASLFC